ncbi:MULTISPECIES: VCBS domain-containing protein [unclassified Rhizobium]|uniref:VCBS domain-containing protein n=1 Tax=unclassified Rhizobium TaxID=2613769 RepID=UPI001C829DB0|nr:MULTISPECIES: VCBS domain-containing protein [unclassified Rhizobium]MBX5216785.1 autoaggregation protein (adhering protein) [Rhizobium sp. NLR9a]MBX5234839.1 autoaggregation protein (adhering protein) [Rhizobium sp. NLR4a]MBX5247273.1 autoaggregation protein (adhering protein) [Rhizobium sp. NLR3b]MBX5270877.1 autoaggregation protein (adhering protein) [Rhizobium sp. NLR17b]MBX5278087.1 autoaggregation protein (adhering protein) [Rhizobium sp. NLR13a]
MTNAKPTAVDDLLVFFEHDWIRGDLLRFASDPEGADMYVRFVNGVRIDAKHGPDHETIIQGKYGTFKVKPDGHFTYELDTTLDVVKNLGKSDQLIEKLSYKMSDGSGGTDLGVLTLAIDGVNEGEKYHEVLDFDDMGVLSRADNFSLPNYRGFALSVNGSHDVTLLNGIVYDTIPGVDAITEDGFSDTVLSPGSAPVSLKMVDGGEFTFQSVSIAELSASPFHLTLTALNDGQIVYQQELEVTGPNLEVNLEDIEEIRFDFMGNSVVMDNFSLLV